MSLERMLLQYSDIPKPYKANLLWRAHCWKLACGTEKQRAFIRASCAADPLFYINTFCWGYDPRNNPPCEPFITYRFQDDFVLAMREEIEASMQDGMCHDVLVLKSRGVGVSWCGMLLFDWYHRFHDNLSFRVLSRKEDYVDNSDDPDSLFVKLDYIERCLPASLKKYDVDPNKSPYRTKLRVYNPTTRSGIKGESTNEHAGRGGRNTAVWRDEEAFCDYGDAITAALSETTNCQFRVSTPNGVGNSYHSAYLKGAARIIHIHWSQHPIFARGLYSIEGGVVTVLDEDWHKRNPGYKFNLNPTHADPGVSWQFLRSPWFDQKEEKADSFAQISQELQLSFLGSGAPYFRADLLASARAQYGMTPRLIGNLEDVLPPQILSKLSVEDTDGRPDKVKVWYPSLPGNRPPSSRTYTIGVDVAAGNGASDSVISVGDNVSMRKVFEYRSNGVTPEDLAKVTIALYRFFTTGTGKPFLAWDGGGHGIPYGTAVMRHGGIHAYYHRPKNERRAKTKTKPGVPSNRDLKKEMFSSFRGALFSGAYITPNAELYEQAEQFVLDPSGTPVHQRSQTTDNDSARGDQHGDVVTSEVILWLAMNNRPVSQTGVQRTPVGSLAWKRQQWKREEANTESMFSY